MSIREQIAEAEEERRQRVEKSRRAKLWMAEERATARIKERLGLDGFAHGHKPAWNTDGHGIVVRVQDESETFYILVRCITGGHPQLQAVTFELVTAEGEITNNGTEFADLAEMAEAVRNFDAWKLKQERPPNPFVPEPEWVEVEPEKQARPMIPVGRTKQSA